MCLLAAHVWRDTMGYDWRRRRRSIYLFDHSCPVLEYFSLPKLASFLPHSSWHWDIIQRGAATIHPRPLDWMNGVSRSLPEPTIPLRRAPWNQLGPRLNHDFGHTLIGVDKEMKPKSAVNPW